MTNRTTFALALFIFEAGLSLGCGTSSGPSVTTTNISTQSGPAPEYLYKQYNDGSLRRSTLDPSTGIMGPETYIETSDVFSALNLGSQPRPMVTPDAKFLYVAAINGSKNNVINPVNAANPATAIFGFAIANAIAGPVGGTNPYFPSVPLNQVTGAVMDGKGRFIYLSDQTSVPNSPVSTNYLRAYLVDSTSGALSDGPIQSQSGAVSLAVNTTDLAGKYVYGYFQTPSTFSLAAFSIDQSTGALSPVSGSPYLLSTTSTVSTSISSAEGLNIAVSASGQFVYVPLLEFTEGNPSYSLFAFSVSPVTGVLVPVAGSPFSVGNVAVSSIALSPDGKFLYIGGETVAQPTSGEAVYSLDPQSGAPKLITQSSSQEYGCCQQNLIDPTGTVLIDFLASTYTDSFLRSPITGQITPVQDENLYNDYINQTTAEVLSGVIVRTP